ncbi:MAG: hypothetical protein L6Q97_15465 [Thermoanaerobaculia bacterium]|nr:hypothetical protein [Thermoanaerobaculia bacterium]
MQKPRATGLFGRNIFAEAFQQFDEEEFFSKLHHKVKNKPYYERYVGFKNTINILSYIFSIASAITSAYAVYWLASWAGASIWLSVVIGCVILVFMEQIKRKASEETWQVYFFEGKLPIGWLLLSFLLFGIGVSASSFGAKEGTKEFAPLAELITSDTTANQYRERVAALEKENQRLARQKNEKGEIFWPAQKQMAKNREVIAKYEARALDRDEKTEGKNENLQTEHDNNVAFASRVLMLVQIFMELCFEGCIAYIWYFYFRAYVERKRLQGIADEEDDPPTAPRFSSSKQAYSPPPPQSQNGQHTEPPVKNTFGRSPIGFFTEAQRAGFSTPPVASTQSLPILPVQVCTEVYREDDTTLYDDLYTVLHEYQRGGKIYLTPYTENQILSRIGQYQRDIEQANHKAMGEEIVSNRCRWLEYWQSKLAELHQKQKEAGIRQ